MSYVIEAAQQSGSYLNTYFMYQRAAERWTNLRDLHELYCTGHLIQMAIAHLGSPTFPPHGAVDRPCGAGATDLYTETGDTTLRDTLERLWQRMVARQWCFPIERPHLQAQQRPAQIDQHDGGALLQPFHGPAG